MRLYAGGGAFDTMLSNRILIKLLTVIKGHNRCKLVSIISCDRHCGSYTARRNILTINIEFPKLKVFNVNNGIPLEKLVECTLTTLFLVGLMMAR